MTPPSAEKLQELMAKATQGEWKAATRQGSWDWLVAVDDANEICQMFHDGTELNEQGEANTQLIVAMHEALPALLADQRRWDWYEAHTINFTGSLKRGGFYVLGFKLHDRYPTLRAAVDAAMERDAQGGKG